MPAAKDPEIKQYPAVKSDPDVSPEVAPSVPRSRRKYFFFLWIVLGALLAATAWVATSSNPLAEGIQEFAGNKHDQAILDTPFSVTPHNFRYYKFTLPEGSTNVAIVGEFAAAADSDNRKSESKGQPQETETGIELYVLSESAFAIWQTGYATNSVFESGRVSQGKVQAELPAGPGVYYLVFSNKFSSKATKKVNADVVLRYKSWLPDWLRRMRSDS